MKVLFWKRAAIVAIAIGVVFGCNSVLQHIGEEASRGSGEAGSGLTPVQSDFSVAPASPGGTGGSVVEQPELDGEETRSFSKTFQIDPSLEDTAGPKFVTSGDIDRDGLLDLVSGWNQSQPVQIHLQRRDANGNISFRSITLAGTTPVGVMAGVEVGQINEDGFLDIVVLVKATGFATFCPAVLDTCTTDQDCNPACETDPNCEIVVACGGIRPGICDTDSEDLSLLDGAILVYFNPASADLIPDGDSWFEMEIGNPFVESLWIHRQFPGKEEKEFEIMKTQPEWGGFTALAVAQLDGTAGDEIIVALNPAECVALGQKPPINTVDVWFNPGPGLAETSTLWGAPDPNNPARRVPLSIMADVPQVKDVVVMDIEGDGDNDVIATFTNAISQNIRWARNPFVPHQAGGPSGNAAVIAGAGDGFRLFETEWEDRPIGQVDSNADVLAVGDIDGDGFDDLVVRSAVGQVVQWFRRPNPLVIEPEFPPNDPVPINRFDFPWPVFTLTEFGGREPEAIAVGDVTGDGRAEVLASAGGAVLWFDGTTSTSAYDQWFPNTITDDGTNDLDADGIADSDDGCPTDPNKIEPGICGCGFADPDCAQPNLTVQPTHINTLLIVDVDADGRNDILATIDRRNGAGLNKDALLWYRNVRTEQTEEPPSRPGQVKLDRPPTR